MVEGVTRLLALTHTRPAVSTAPEHTGPADTLVLWPQPVTLYSCRFYHLHHLRHLPVACYGQRSMQLRLCYSKAHSFGGVNAVRVDSDRTVA